MMRPLTTTPALSPAERHRRWQLLWHRSLQRLGWPGLLGVVLVVIALILGALAWQAKLRLKALEQASRVQASSTARATSASSVAARPSLAQEERLPTSQDIHALIAQIQLSAAQHQLQWQAADYRYKAATAESLARLEVHGSLRGAYKPLRLWLAQLKQEVPSMLLQEASISRPNADVAEVDAKLVLVFALADAPLGPGASGGAASVGLSAPAATPPTPPSSGAAR